MVSNNLIFIKKLIEASNSYFAKVVEYIKNIIYPLDSIVGYSFLLFDNSA